MSTLTVSIANTAYPIKIDSFHLPDQIEHASQCNFIVVDENDAFTFYKGQSVVVDDSVEGTLFTGQVHTINRDKKNITGTYVERIIECVDLHAIPDAQSSDKQYSEQYAGIILIDQIKKMRYQGITANYALDQDETLADFTAGTLTNTVATSNGLELAPAGVPVSIIENTTAIFGSGSLTNCTASGDTLIPTATNAIKIVGTQSIPENGNSHTYIKIWSGSVTIISGRYLEYDLWIASSSPEARIAVDFVCSDGTTFRDGSAANDEQDIARHPGTDLSGFAVDTWYHRKFYLESLVGKTISYVSVAIEGNNAGTYTGYIKNVLETNGSGTTINTFFGGSLNVNPPQRLQNNGYSNVSCTVVPTYDCSNAQRVSSSYSISAVDLLKDSSVILDATLPDNTDFELYYSINGGNSYIQCANNAALPSLPAGLSLASKSIQFLQKFIQNSGANPEEAPVLNSMQVALNTSYVATKSDVTYSATTNAEWNDAGVTFTNTQAPADTLQLIGAVRDFDDGDLSNITMYGGGASGPGTSTVTHRSHYKHYWLTTIASSDIEGRGRCDFAGQIADGIIEADIHIDVTTAHVGFCYRTTGWSNYDANYAYAVEFKTNSVTLQRGSNSSAASTGTRTEVATATLTLSASETWHHIRITFTGDSHIVDLDGVQVLSATDGTYTAAGYVGMRVGNTNPADGYQAQFDNVGILKTLTGTWLSPSTSLTSAANYGDSVVTWEDVSTDASLSTLLVESTINGGSSWQTVTNGGSISGLTDGQSLSGVSVQFRITLTTASASSMPQIRYFVARVLGQFSSSGTRITPMLDLSPAGRSGATLASYVASTPTNTGVVQATSTDGTSYTTVASGDGIDGITSQPTATLDTFDTATSASYTSSNQSGGSLATWTWDATNSRLTAVGGTNALLLLNSPASVNEVSAIIDLSRADAFGMICNYQAANSFFYFEIHDNSASSNPGMAYLNNLSAGTLYPLASASIDFPRGSYLRFRLTYLAGIFTLYMDGVQILSFDQNPYGLPSAGQVGLWNKSGTAYCYNFRIQPQGDDLSSSKAYARLTLTSTDPTATPQVTVATLAALSPNIGIGALIPTADYRQKYTSDNINDLAGKSNYIWNIPPSGAIFFNERTVSPAPWYLSEDDILVNGLTVEKSGDLYRNRQTLTGVIDDDGTTTFVTRDNVGQFAGTISQQDYIDQSGLSVPTLTILNHASAAHTSNSDSGDLDVSLCESISIDVDVTAVSGSSPTLRFFVDRKGADGIYYTIWSSAAITATRQLSTDIGPNEIYKHSLGSLIRLRWEIGGSTPSFTFSASILGVLNASDAGIGVVEAIEDVSSQNLNIAGANELADSRLQEYGKIGRIVKFGTIRTGLSAGQAISATINSHKMYDELLLVTNVDRTADVSSSGSVYYWFNITAVSGPALDTWRKAMNQTVRGG